MNKNFVKVISFLLPQIIIAELSMTANFAVHKRGLSSTDDGEGSSWGDSEQESHLSMVRADKLLSHKKRKLYAKSCGKVKSAQGGRGRGKGVATLETPDGATPKATTQLLKFKDRAKRTAQKLKWEMTGTPKKMPDHSEDLPLVPVGEDILDSTTKSQITKKETSKARQEFTVSPVPGASSKDIQTSSPEQDEPQVQPSEQVSSPEI